MVPNNAHAVKDPTATPNNKFGIHILFESELYEASRLVNSSGGDWGYITIPIQASDRDLNKWQKLMDEAKRLHVIPILRLATENYYFETRFWRKPNQSDILDFANFLNSLNWPTKNRYVIIFNEVNRADEWGGKVDPHEYARILSFAVTTFKSASQDFFIISSGMDNASVNSAEAMNEYDYFLQMNQSVPGIFNQIDGISSHSYPNPAFSQPPSILSGRSIDTYIYEKKFIESLSSKSFPIFITETGWDSEKLGKAQIAQYYSQAFQNAWSEDYIVAVTPFVLSAQMGPFTKFSFLDSSGKPNEIHESYSSIQKVKGTPEINADRKVLASKSNTNLPVRDFSEHNDKPNNSNRLQQILMALFMF